MHGVFEKSRGKSVVRTDKSDADDWFANACKDLLPTKPGYELHLMSGFDERSCQRYAAGHVAPPAYFLRTLLRSPQGWTWLCAAMGGSDADWWRDVRYAYEIIAVFEAKRKELLSGGSAGGNLGRISGP